MQHGNLETCIELFERLHQQHNVDESQWAIARVRFAEALASEDSASRLEIAVLNPMSWTIPIDCKFDLLDKAKQLGCNSREFLKDFYGFKATYLEPDDPERAVMFKMLHDLNGQGQGV